MDLIKKYLGESNENISGIQLRKLLWDKGLGDYQEELHKMKKVLNNFSSISALPSNMTEKGLATVSWNLNKLAKDLKSAREKIEKAK